MQRGAIWWADLAAPSASEPGYRRPVLIVQSNSFNRSAIRTVVVIALTSNMNLARAPGNVSIARDESGLPKDSVANVSQLLTIDKEFLTEKVNVVNANTMKMVEEGLRLVLSI